MHYWWVDSQATRRDRLNDCWRSRWDDFCPALATDWDENQPAEYYCVLALSCQCYIAVDHCAEILIITAGKSASAAVRHRRTAQGDRAEKYRSRIYRLDMVGEPAAHRQSPCGRAAELKEIWVMRRRYRSINNIPLDCVNHGWCWCSARRADIRSLEIRVIPHSRCEKPTAGTSTLASMTHRFYPPLSSFLSVLMISGFHLVNGRFYFRGNQHVKICMRSRKYYRTRYSLIDRPGGPGVAPGTKVGCSVNVMFALMQDRNWGYTPGWWDSNALLPGAPHAALRHRLAVI